MRCRLAPALRLSEKSLPLSRRSSRSQIFRAFWCEGAISSSSFLNQLYFFLKCDSRCLTHAPSILGGIRAPPLDPRAGSVHPRRESLGTASDAAFCSGISAPTPPFAVGGLLRHQGARFTDELKRCVSCASLRSFRGRSPLAKLKPRLRPHLR